MKDVEGRGVSKAHTHKMTRKEEVDKGKGDLLPWKRKRVLGEKKFDLNSS